MDMTEENRQEYKELQRRVKREVSKAKQEAYVELYTRLDTREGQKDLYRLARQRDRDGKDVQQVRVIKDRDGRVLTSEESVQRRWKEYSEELMNEENEREKRVDKMTSVEQKVDKIRKDEVRKALKRMKSGKAVGPDDIPVELKKEECCEDFRQKLRQALGGQVVLPDDWETTAEVIRVTGRKVLGVSSGRRKEDKETWWWNEGVLDSRKRLAKKKWDMDRTKENRQEYKELQRRVKREVSKAKQEAYDELYTRLDTREGQKDLYRLARQRDRDGKDMQQLKKEECCEDFRQKLRQALGGQVVLPDDWETTAEVIRVTGRKVLGVSSGRRKEDKETWWWNEEVEHSIQRKRLAKKKWDMDRTKENRQEYKELQRRVKREVYKAKQEAYDELYIRLDTREGQKDLYRLARQRDRDGKDVQQVRVIKDRDGRVLTSAESVQRRWKEYFEELMNEENEREKRVEGVTSVEQQVDKIRKDEVRKALKRMKSGKAVGPDDIPVEDSIQRKRLAKKKWDMDRTEENRQEYKELQRRVKREVSKAKQEAYDELYTRLDTREGQKDLYRLVRQRDRDGKDVQQVRVIKDRDGRVLTSEESVQRRWKEYFEELMNEENEREKRVEEVTSVEQKDTIRKDEVRKALKRMKSGKAVGPDDIPVEVWKVVQDMYERSRTVVRCAVGQTEEFKVEVGLHQGSALSPFLFAMVMDQLSKEVRQESPYTMMFADDIVICSESREQVEENLERWRFALERRGMKVSRSKTEYMCVNEREGSGTVRLQGEEVKKVQEFKYLGSTVQSNGECGKEVKKQVQVGMGGERCRELCVIEKYQRESRGRCTRQW
ncbi:hypothetical protein PDJAM_G00163190 [Pangasius djambal]|uniref:Uncharacterized protein n=1 Tax=Pangasius djambal TaxID=1691987 RepID=A0ACC5ZL81_9TELE|nr:hypothetical protein [Pangasius djambal]